MQVSKVHQNLIKVTAKAKKYSTLTWLCLRAVADFKPSGQAVSGVEDARKLFLATGTNEETWLYEFNAFRIEHGFISGGFLVWQDSEKQQTQETQQTRHCAIFPLSLVPDNFSPEMSITECGIY